MNFENRYRAHPESVVNGGTIDLTVDLGFYTRRETRLHLSEVDTEETQSTEEPVVQDPEETVRQAEQELTKKNFVDEWIATAGTGGEWPLVIEVHKPGDDRFGPYFGIVERITDGAVLNVDLIEEFGEDLYPDRDRDQ
ncbi:hypothetical protein BRD01_04420 [Halobacteriales archaeon QS_8_65_32]|jgi:hypothetical protein|nr:MAG: hypothetical protein BRD01_04420 [Halobacteriales archaeon QS_8_65_32]